MIFSEIYLSSIKLPVKEQLKLIVKTICTFFVSFVYVWFINRIQEKVFCGSIRLPYYYQRLPLEGRRTKKSDLFIRAGEQANFLAAPAPDFFFKRLLLRLLIFSEAAPAPGIFFEQATAPAPRGQKNPAPVPDYWFDKIFFFPQTSKV